jgi:NAD(P)-dependent dehydrogenase (short-subunit alcohol dehydrogenase family)
MNDLFHEGNINEKSFLVTGGAGFIGSHIAEYLLKNGAGKVRVLDNMANGFQSIFRYAEGLPGHMNLLKVISETPIPVCRYAKELITSATRLQLVLCHALSRSRFTLMM